jgi:hypothetical protein
MVAAVAAAGVEALALAEVMHAAGVMVMVAGSTFAAVDVISATAGAEPSARINRRSIGVIIAPDSNEKIEIRCLGQSGAPVFFESREVVPLALPYRMS